MLPFELPSSLFLIFHVPKNPAMAEPPGLQQPPRDPHELADTVTSSGGEMQQQPQMQQQAPMQQPVQQREKPMPSSSVPQTSNAQPPPASLPPPPPPRDTTVATSEEELAPPVRLTASTSREETSPAPQRLVSTIVNNNTSMRATTPPPSTPGSGFKQPSFAGVDRGLLASSEDYDEAPLLPRGTRILVKGNNRTRATFIGKEGTVRTAVGLGGWHLLVRWFGV